MTFELLEVRQLIKQHYEVDGNEAMTNKYSLLYFTAKDEFINKSRLGKMDEAKLNIELEQTRDKIQEMSFHQRIQSMALWSAVVIALLALTILAVLYVHYRKTKRTNRMLYDKNLVLLNANKQLMPDPAPAQQNAQEEPSQEDRDLLDKITAVMESCNEIYDEGFGLSRLAELVDSNTKYVSRAINNCRQSNFSALLNEYRIKEACRRLMDTATYGSLSIEGVARSVGYKSRSNFTTIFKGSVGISPSAFQRLAREGKVDAALTPAN
ncbi:MAG: helix-turn-helix transcriptional regulator [Bacteroidales bacterium]|nr:helix-turn-helix transcriptional regulator [Candidatus Sodaliphilus aphodohippi]